MAMPKFSKWLLACPTCSNRWGFHGGKRVHYRPGVRAFERTASSIQAFGNKVMGFRIGLRRSIQSSEKEVDSERRFNIA